MFPSDIYRLEDRLSRRDSPSVASLVIDTTPETVLEEPLLEEEGDTADASLHVSRILRGCVLSSIGLGILDLTSVCSYFQLQPPWFGNGALQPYYQHSHIQNRLPPAFTRRIPSILLSRNTKSQQQQQVNFYAFFVMLSRFLTADEKQTVARHLAVPPCKHRRLFPSVGSGPRLCCRASLAPLGACIV